jgi:hypothetical protein
MSEATDSGIYDEMKAQAERREQERQDAERAVTLIPGRAAASIEFDAEQIGGVLSAMIDASDVYEADAEQGKDARSAESRRAFHAAFSRLSAAESALAGAAAMRV